MRILAIVLLTGCSVVSPPPLVPAHNVSAAAAEGTTSVSLAVGFGGGVFLEDGFGFAVRVTNQVSESLEVGGDLTIAFPTRKALRSREESEERRGAVGREATGRRPNVIVGAQLVGRYSLSGIRGIVAIPFGVGLGLADTGLRSLTAHSGVRLASNNGRFDAYGQPVVAFSIPIERGQPIEKGEKPATTFYIGGTVGAIANADGEWGTSSEFTALYSSDVVVFFVSQAATHRPSPSDI